MAEMYYDDAADLSIIQGRKVAVIGYGSQGHAHALNLRDSGVDVRVGLAEGSKSIAKATDQGLRCSRSRTPSPRRTSSSSSPPTRCSGVYRDHRPEPRRRGHPALRARLQHPLRVHQAAGRQRRHHGRPQGPGHIVRREFVDGRGVPVLLAVEQDASGSAWALVVIREGDRWPAGRRIKTTFTEECETDLFGEQSVLCGGLSQLIMYGFETLTEAGYQPEVAYFECLHEVKLIVDLAWSKVASPSSAGRSPTRPSMATTSPVPGSSTPRSRRT